MLTANHTILPAADIARARGFYHDALGLDPSMEPDGRLIYGDGPIMFEVYETEYVGTAKNTQMEWETDDLDAEMTRLRSKGVDFMDFETPTVRTDHGVVEDELGRAAWFTDSEGNILCLAQRR